MKSPKVMPPVLSLRSTLDNRRGKGQCSNCKPVYGEEDQVGVVRGVAEREYLLVDLLEGLLVHDPVRTLLLESPVEVADLA